MDKSQSEIELPSVDATNHNFIEVTKSTLKRVEDFDITLTETKILCKVLPAVQCRFDHIFSENCSLFETINDEIVYDTLRENLEAIYQLTEIIQELLNIINQKSPTHPTHIESLLKCLPLYIQYIGKHWESSSETYKNKFCEPLSNIFEVAKHLYASFLIFLEQSLLIEGDAADIALIGETLTGLCEMPKYWSGIDSSCILSSWKCFITVATKHSLLSDCYFNVSTCIHLLSDDICRVLELLSDAEPKLFSRQLKMCIILVKVLSKICIQACDQILKSCSFELLLSFTKILSYSPEYYKSLNLSEESIIIFEHEFVQVLNDFLRHLLLVQTTMFKEELKNYTHTLDSLGLLEKFSYGTLNLFDKVFYVICSITSDWSEVLAVLINGTFLLINYCQKHIFSHNGGIYQKLIVNITAAILTQDVHFQSLNILLKHLFQDDLFVSFLALEVLTLVSSNIDNNENLSLILNLLYSVNELSSGFFTCRPEMVWLKCLLQRLFCKLPDCHKEQIIKMFSSEESIEVWRVLGFQHLSPVQVQPLLEPIVSMTAECIRSFEQEVNVEDIVNIGESIKLISSCSSLQLPAITEYVSFVEKFWLLNLDQELLQNNLIKYLTFTTFRLAVNSLRPDLIISKLKILLQNNSYWILTFKASHLLLTSAQDANASLLQELSGLLKQSMKTDLIMQELQFEMLNTLNQTQPDILNQLLDASEPGLAHQIFEYIDSFRKKSNIYLNQAGNHKITGFTHKCLQWREHVDIEAPPAKKFKFSELLNSKENDQPVNVEKRLKKPRNKQKIPPSEDSIQMDGCLMTDAIESLKGEVKCLIKLKKTEKLTPKNAADLRIIMSQLSSLM